MEIRKIKLGCPRTANLACVCACVGSCLCVCLSIFLSFCLPAPVCLSACLSVCLPVRLHHLYLCLSVSVSVCHVSVPWLAGCPSVHLSVCLSVCLPVLLSACPSVCLSVCLSACLPACLHVYLCTLPTGFCPTTTILCSPKHNKYTVLTYLWSKMPRQLMKSDWTRNIIWVHLAPNNSICHTIIALQRTR